MKVVEKNWRLVRLYPGQVCTKHIGYWKLNSQYELYEIESPIHVYPGQGIYLIHWDEDLI